MKIGIVLYPTFGGSGVVATELGKELALKGHEVHFITYSLPVRLGSFRTNIFYHEVSVNDYPLFDYPPYELVLSSKLVDVVEHEKLDILHVHYAIPHASAAYMARSILKKKGIKIPYITTLHGTDITLVGKDPSFESVITFAINESDAVTAVSESLRQDTYDSFDIDNGIQVIPNFIRMEKYQKKKDMDLRRKYAEDNERIICHISNFRPVKRIDDILQVFKNVSQEIPSKLLLVGDGPERYRLEARCRELGICGKTKYLGKLRDTSHILSISDLYMLTSEKESFGVSALEAMASGVPVISTNTGGLPEVNINGESGFTSPVGDITDMSLNAIKILKEEKSIKKYGDRAREIAAEFDISKILPIYEKLYESLI
ncbi:MAG: N-acetyl-alpha-D-glucosaminyl L-malate synthase BshA [Crocinitomicaceae bacterium]